MNVRRPSLTTIGETTNTDITGRLIDHLDLWTGAVTQKRSSGRGGNGKVELTGIKKLRELILELAVRGKLVEQDPDDEPASVLLERIAEEKARLVKEGKIKKPKKLPEVTEEEKPFALPCGWAWARFDDIAFPQAGFAFKSKNFNEIGEGLPIIRIRDVGQEFSGTYYSGEYRDEFLVEKGEYLISMDGIFRVAKSELDLALLNQRVTRLKFILDEFSQDYFANSLQLRLNDLQGVKAYTTVDHLSGKQISESLTGVPPEAEQQRIVDRFKELMALCDRLEQQVGDQLEAHEVLVDTLLDALTRSEDAAELAENWARIAEHFDTLFTTEASIDKLKQAVLQLAVMGRLVPQDPNEEPVSALHDQIITERNRLIKTEGMRTKASEKISSKKHYIPTPKHWVWVRLGNTAKFIDYRGKTPKKVGCGRRLITAKNIRFGFIDKNPEEFISESGYVDWMTRGFPRVGDTLFTPEAPLGNAANVDIEEGFALAQRAICFQWHIPETAKFMLMQILSQFFQKQLSLNATGMTATGIKASKLKEIPITLPPLEEQHRIVEKVDELMALCDRLKARLGEAGETRIHLAEAVVEQAVSQAGRNDLASPLFR